MRVLLLLTLLSPLCPLPCATAQEAILGRWQTIDEDSGEARSVIEIYRRGDKYFGKIAEILTDNKDALCTECEGKDKNRPILGLIIIKDLAYDGDDEFSGGSIFDPQKGASYRLSAWTEDDEPGILYIRGKHWTGLYRTQRWRRAE